MEKEHRFLEKVFPLRRKNSTRENSIKNSNSILLAKEGKGGLGIIEIQLSSYGVIYIKSDSIDNPGLTHYSATISNRDGVNSIREESYINARYILNHSINQPKVEDVEKVINSGYQFAGKRMSKRDIKFIINVIKDAYSNPPASNDTIGAAPRFSLEKSKLSEDGGLHWHLFENIGNKDTGYVVILEGEKIYLDRHRNGKVKNPISTDEIGKKSKEEIIYTLKQILFKMRNEAKSQLRKRSKNALLIGNLDDRDSKKAKKGWKSKFAIPK